MSKVVGITMAEHRFAELQRVARATGWSPDELAGRLIEEGLRQREFPGLEFRDTPIGRQAFVAGTRIGVWQLALMAPEYAGEAEVIGTAIALAPSAVAVALAYAAAYPEEIEAAIDASAALNRRVATLVAERRTSDDGA